MISCPARYHAGSTWHCSSGALLWIRRPARALHPNRHHPIEWDLENADVQTPNHSGNCILFQDKSSSSRLCAQACEIQLLHADKRYEHVPLHARQVRLRPGKARGIIPDAALKIIFSRRLGVAFRFANTKTRSLSVSGLLRRLPLHACFLEYPAMACLSKEFAERINVIY